MLVYLAISSFALAALVGLITGTRHLMNAGVSVKAALLHGFFGVAGVVLLLAFCIGNGFAAAHIVSIGLFLIAALVGALLLSFQLKNRRLPPVLIFLHG